VTVRHLFRLYRAHLAADRRVRWASAGAAAALVAAVALAPWLVLPLAFFAATGAAIVRSPLFEGIVGDDEVDDWA
jgi:hypothetical protein